MYESLNFGTKGNALSILSLLFVWTLRRLDGVNSFTIPLTHKDHPSRGFFVDLSSRPCKLCNIMSERQQENSYVASGTRRMATIERGSMATSSSEDEGKNMGKGRQQVMFQKVIRPTRDMPDVLFLGYLIEYLEKHFELPSDLPMVYENMVVNNGIESEHHKNDRYTLAWDSPLSPSSDATRMEVEVVGIYTDGNKKTDVSSTSPSVPNMAMVVVRRPNNESNRKRKAIPAMMKGLFDDSERRIIQALDRGLDDFVAGKIRFEMNDQLAEQRTQGEIPPNFKTAQEVIDAELVDEHPGERDNSNKVDAENVVFDTYATTETGDDLNKSGGSTKKDNISPANHEGKMRTKQDIADAKARAMATMKKPAEEAKKNKVSSPDKDQNPSIDFAVEAAKKAAQKKVVTKKKNAQKSKQKVVVNKPDADSTDFAVAAARKAAAMRKKKESPSIKPQEDFAVAAARKMAASSVASKTKGTTSKKDVNKAAKNKNCNNKVRGEAQVISSEYRGPQTSNGPSMPPVPEGWKPRDYFKDQRVFSGTISVPKNAKTKVMPKAKRVAKKSIQPPSKRASAIASKISERSNDLERISKPKSKTKSKPKSKSKSASKAEPKMELKTKSADAKTVAKKKIENRKLNTKLVDDKGDEGNSSVVDPLLEQSTKDGNMPSKNEIELEIMKAAKSALEEIEGQGHDMTPEEMLKDILKFDEEQKKEEKPGSGFASGAFEKAKELMKDRHRQIKEQNKEGQQQQEQVEFREMNKPMSDSFPQYPKPVDTPNETKRKLTPEEELRQMFAAGQKIAEGKIDLKTEPNAAGSLQATRTTEEDIDRLIAEEKTVSKYARVLDDELAELEVRINSSPGEELDGPPQNPLFDVMSGPEKYDPNVDMDAVNYPGALPGTADVKLPKELNEAIKQAEFAATVLMQMETKETVDETTGETKVEYFSGEREITAKQAENLQTVVDGAVKSGIIDDPVEIMKEASRLQLILDELWNQPEERFYDIASNYKDLLLSERFVGLIRQRMRAMADRDLDALRNDDESLKEPHEREREILGQLVNYAQALIKETRALGAELEAHQLEVVRSICKVAMDPEYTTEEETAMALSDAVRDMRSLFDDAFVAYLKYAIAEEESRLARAGLLDDPDYNQWLFVLKIVQQGVCAEIAKGINRYIEHIWYVLRMETPRQRRQLLSDLIDDMPTMDVRPFVRVVDNIVGSLGDGVRGNFDGLVPLGEMTNKLLQLQNDVKELLPPERIALKSKDADEWAAMQKKRLLEQRKIGQQRLKAVNEVADREDDVEAMFGQGEELDRFD